MKRMILALLAVGTIASANAQSNSILLYGNVGFSNGNDDAKTNSFNWNVDPGIGYQFNENWTIGLNFGFNSTSSKPDGADRSTVNNYHIGPFIRYSHNITNVFYWFVQGNVGYEGGYTTTGGNPATDKHNGFGINVMPAVGINLGHCLALNFSIGNIGFATDKADGASNSNNSFGLDFGLNDMTIGVSKNFRCGAPHHHREPGDEMRHDDEGSHKKHGKKDKDEDE